MNRRWIPVLLAITWVPLVSALVAALPDKDEPQLRIALAIPIKQTWEPKPVRRIRFRQGQPNRQPDFHVVITNHSDRPVRLWQEWCSWGHRNLSFEFIGADEKAVPCVKERQVWTRNYPDDCVIGPSEHFVLDVYFNSEQWRSPDFQSLKPAKDGSIAMRAVYETIADDETAKQGVWTGKLVSEVRQVVLEQ